LKNVRDRRSIRGSNPLKNFQKREKKACHRFQPLAIRGGAMTNGPNQPFKKSLKKVKKKLVNALEI
jgi:hypothetical protein